MFYTYLWLRYDGMPYYVGKGQGNRAFEAHKQRRWKCPTKDRVLVQEFSNEQDAFEAEKFLIFYYGRKDKGDGCLLNLTDGGDGFSGGKHSEEVKQAQRERMKGNIPSKTTRERLSEAGKGKHKYWQGKKFSDEHRTRIKDALKRAKPRSKAQCHPHLEHYCKGLCMVCYNRQYWLKRNSE